MIKAAILTVSNSRTKETDTSGKEIKKNLDGKDFEILEMDIVSDEKKKIKNKLIFLSEKLKTDIVFTTGGTGLGPCDVTPEATLEVIDREVPGLSELIRIEGSKKTQRAALSRGISGIRGGTLIINLPGSPKGAKESLGAILELLPHAVDMVKGCGHPEEGAKK